MPTRRAAEELADRLTERRVPRRRSTTAAWPPAPASSGTRTFLADKVADHGGDLGVRHGHRQARTSAGWRTWRCPTRRTATCRRSAGPAGTAQPARALLLLAGRGRGAAAVLQRRRAGPSWRSATSPPRCAPAPHDPDRAARRRPASAPRKLGQLLALLEQVGAAVAGAGNRLDRPAGTRRCPAAAAAAAVAEVERQQTVQRSRIDMMRGFARDPGVPGAGAAGLLRRAARRGRCGHCDNCADGTAEADTRRRPTSRSPCTARCGTREWGAGMVMGYEEDRMTVLFDEVGYKTLSVPVVPNKDC